ncbi:MAG: chalcone isomerase family protein [Pseudomonadales bacterium]|nr:chalcone isomerase family protein [Pseudomonadales bacterium]
MIRPMLFVAVLLVSQSVSATPSGMQMVGQARLQFMFWPVYDSRLYTSNGEFQEGQLPLRLEIEYLRDVASAELVEHTRKEWQRLQPLAVPEQQWLRTLSRLWPDVGKNDVLVLVLDEWGRSTFLLNGQPLGSVDEPAFGQRFLDIWLSPATSRPDLRLALLGRD